LHEKKGVKRESRQNTIIKQIEIAIAIGIDSARCNRAAVSRNRYGVEKTVDTHKILINAIKCYICHRRKTDNMYNGQKKKDKQDLQNITQKTKD
jgi:hypothetical protein